MEGLLAPMRTRVGATPDSVTMATTEPSNVGWKASVTVTMLDGVYIILCIRAGMPLVAAVAVVMIEAKPGKLLIAGVARGDGQYTG